MSPNVLNLVLLLQTENPDELNYAVLGHIGPTNRLLVIHWMKI